MKLWCSCVVSLVVWEGCVWVRRVGGEKELKFYFLFWDINKLCLK